MVIARFCAIADGKMIMAVLSVFVNPKQFGPKEDFAEYPRREQADKKLAKKEKVDIMFIPTAKEMYPEGYLTYIEVERMTQECCAADPAPGILRVSRRSSESC